MPVSAVRCCGLLVLSAIVSLFAQERPVRTLPRIEGVSLSGKTVSFPRQGTTRQSIVIVTFNSDHRKASSEWFSKIKENSQLRETVDVYQLLDIGDVPHFVQPMISWGMHHRVSAAQRGQFIVAFQGDDHLRTLLGHSDVYAVLTAGDGKLLWTEEGPFSDSKLAHIREHLQSDGANADAERAMFRETVAHRCRELIEQNHLPGLAVAVVEHGNLAFTEACGLANKATLTPFSDTTLINVGSLSKSLTTWGVLHLVETGHFELDSSVDSLLRQWHLPPSKYDVDQVTVRRVLNHTAGLSVPTAPWFPADKPVPRLVDVLNGTAGGHKVEVTQPPGSSWAYSGGGFEVLQLLVEEQSHQPFARYMQTAILNPLGLTHSTFDPAAHPTSEMAVAYDSNGNAVPEYRLAGVAAGGYYTTIRELGLFLAAYSEDNAQKRWNVLQTKSLAEIATSVVPVTLAGVAGAFYGLGHGVHRTKNGDIVLYHSGGNPGVMAYYLFSTKSGNGLAVVTNSNNGVSAVKELLQLWSNQCGQELPPLY